jgi:hypothetical protein
MALNVASSLTLSNTTLLVGAVAIWRAQMEAVQAASAGPAYDRQMSHADAIMRYDEIIGCMVETISQDWAEDVYPDAASAFDWLELDIKRARRHACACVGQVCRI